MPIVLIVLAIAITVVASSVFAFVQLRRIHPSHGRVLTAIFIVGNAMWPFFPWLNARTDFIRFIRATLGPPWFAWASFAFLYAMVIMLLRVLWIARRRREAFHRIARRSSRAFLIAAAIGGVIGCWQALVPVRIEQVRVPLRNLPPALEGTRLALMGDLHVGLYTRPSRLQVLFSAAAAQKPAALLIAGDLIDDDPHFVPKLLRGASTLPGPIPIFAVLGNHEMYGDSREVVQQMRGSRIRLLVNEGAVLTTAASHDLNARSVDTSATTGRPREEASLWIAGISDYAGHLPGLRPDLDAALRSMPANSFPILVSHQPKSFDDAIARSLPLTVCAHTHGGQLGFRPLRWSLAGLFLPYHMGLYRRGASQLYVNTGTGYWLLPFRLGMTPEITLLELHRQ